jgi:hypothetical protein
MVHGVNHDGLDDDVLIQCRVCGLANAAQLPVSRHVAAHLQVRHACRLLLSSCMAPGVKLTPDVELTAEMVWLEYVTS